MDGHSQSIDMSSSRYIFMRWKEQFFVNVSADCGLTIAGFYYVCFDRELGTIEVLNSTHVTPIVTSHQHRQHA